MRQLSWFGWMAGLVVAIHVFLPYRNKDVARHNGMCSGPECRA
jgi:hypothetical protein